MSAVDRAAEVIDRTPFGRDWDADSSRIIAEALVAEGLLLTDEQARLIEVGRAFENHQAEVQEWLDDKGELNEEVKQDMLDAFAEQRRLIALGKAVEAAKARHEAFLDEYGYTIATINGTFKAIYAEAERSGE